MMNGHGKYGHGWALLLIGLLVGCSGGRPPVAQNPAAGLPPCPPSPNCVSSQASDPEQRVEPLRYDDAPAAARARLLTVINGMERSQVTQASADTLQVEFRSAVFGFVDDVEFRFRQPGLIELRSAARSGYYDFGVNRERVAQIRARFESR